MRASASGFCVYNDPAIAIAWLLAEGRRADRLRRHRRAPRRRRAGRVLRRPAGADDQPARDARALLFPGTGWPSETGGAGAGRLGGERGPARAAPGTPAGCAPSTRSCRRCCAPSRPQILVSQHGCDTHRLDPLAHLRADRRRAARRARRDPPARPRDRGRPLAADRGRRLRAGPGRAPDLDAPAGRGGRPAASTRQARRRTAWRDYVRRRTGQAAADADDRGRPSGGLRARSSRATTRPTRSTAPSSPPAGRGLPRATAWTR